MQQGWRIRATNYFDVYKCSDVPNDLGTYFSVTWHCPENDCNTSWALRKIRVRTSEGGISPSISIQPSLAFCNGPSSDIVVSFMNSTYDMSAVAITSIATVATPASGKQIRLMSGTFSVSSACSVLFENNAGGTTVFRTPVLLANVPYNFDLGMNGILVTTANHVLKATASTGTVTITGTLRGTEE